ncbi:MAG: multicopper oxidase domain-containing protein [Pseudomonadota bacterium]
MLTRRKILKTLGLSAAALAAGLRWPTSAHAQTSTVPLHEGNPLRIPPLLEGIQEGAEKRFELLLQQGETEFFTGVKTPTLGINGSFLGPTLRFSRDDLVRFQVTNQIGEPSTLHWHGLHVPARSDGGPHQTIEHNGRWEPLIRIMQPAGTFWYHSHMMHKTGEQVYRGLAGMMILDDDTSRSLSLPSEYGVDDIPVIIQDRRFKKDGTLDYMSQYDDMVQGMQGDIKMVNGAVDPYFVPTSTKARLRILNASNSRKYMLAFSDHRPFQVIASDGGLLTAPVTMDMVMLATGERVEIIADFSDGQPVTLVNVPMVTSYQDSPGAMSRIMRAMGSEGFDILRFYPVADLRVSAPVPETLTTIKRRTAEEAVKTRTFRLQMGTGSRGGGDRGPTTGYRNGFGGGHGGGDYYINGRQMVMDFINERVTLGDTEIWEIFNSSPMPHPFHIHSGQFQILDRDGIAPPPHELGFKDTVLVKGRETVRVIISFTDFSDEHHPYMYHCHMLEHEDRGMMGQFLVV